MKYANAASTAAMGMQAQIQELLDSANATIGQIALHAPSINISPFQLPDAPPGAPDGALAWGEARATSLKSLS
jgi:hypothetical protein